MMLITYGDVGGEPRAAADRQFLVHEVQVERVLGGEGGHEAQPLAERHPDVRPNLVTGLPTNYRHTTRRISSWLNAMLHRKLKNHLCILCLCIRAFLKTSRNFRCTIHLSRGELFFCLVEPSPEQIE